MNEIYKKKLKSFIIYTSVFSIIFITSFVVGKYREPMIPFGVEYYWGTFCVFGSMLFGVIFPIILRLVFHNRAIKNRKVILLDYIKQQKLELGVTFLGTIFVAPVCLFALPVVHTYVTVLAALYAIYSVLPSAKKITGEINLYKIDLEEKEIPRVTHFRYEAYAGNLILKLIENL